ncbi:hypothetical protein [Yellowstone lake phycodnavirus 2]|uniref:hypothetical protein n=1 Tax=Yellowstone lake phycodnavirus 2 TaxID=1586714 RepID=UPI0006EB852C|nr:hypothetical protein AR678_gp081 [Yellowstone lake phycodnavirus 2]BAT22355.1 hypothetical protein [Yellowstone lake phycodnavirus 2]
MVAASPTLSAVASSLTTSRRSRVSPWRTITSSAWFSRRRVRRWLVCPSATLRAAARVRARCCILHWQRISEFTARPKDCF